MVKPAAYILTVSVLASMLSSCERPVICDCFKGTGEIITEERVTYPFDKIELFNKTDLHLHYAPVHAVKVTAGKNLIDNVTAEVDHGMLRIRNINKCNWVRDFDNTFSVDVYTPEIHSLHVYNSSGNIYCDDPVSVDKFEFESWGSTGDYHLTLNCGTVVMALQTGPASLIADGTIGVGYLWNSGGGRFDASSIQADDIYCTNLGTNDLLIKVKKRLEAIINFSGSIYYQGDPPDLKLTDNGSGDFYKF